MNESSESSIFEIGHFNLGVLFISQIDFKLLTEKVGVLVRFSIGVRRIVPITQTIIVNLHKINMQNNKITKNK